MGHPEPDPIEADEVPNRQAPEPARQLSLFGEPEDAGAPRTAEPAKAPAGLAGLERPAQPLSHAVAPERLAPASFAHPRADREMLLEGHRVAFEFRRARRRSIGFVIGPEGLTVSAPRWVGVGEVEARP